MIGFELSLVIYMNGFKEEKNVFKRRIAKGDSSTRPKV